MIKAWIQTQAGRLQNLHFLPLHYPEVLASTSKQTIELVNTFEVTSLLFLMIFFSPFITSLYALKVVSGKVRRAEYEPL